MFADVLNAQKSEITTSLIKASIENEMKALKNSQDPQPDPNIGYLFVLSASNSYLRKVVQIKESDIDDDYNWMTLAIKTAKKIVALKANVHLSAVNRQLETDFGPKIIYNGSISQNNDLKEALDRDLIDYPKEKFVILDLPQDQINTKGQFISIKQGMCVEPHASAGIVSHAYHYPRFSRMLGEDAPLNPFEKTVKVSAFLVDRHFASPGIDEKVHAEIQKIPTYIEKGDLALNPYSIS